MRARSGPRSTGEGDDGRHGHCGSLARFQEIPTKIQLSCVLRSFSAQDPGGWAHVIRHAETLDRAGVDRLAVSDHVVFGEDLTAYGRPEVGGQAGGMQPTGPDGHWLEPMTLLALLAGR